ncbi:MAG: efflux RND transporter permease subunit, partial [Gammaproteobacteria bacterium]|nr:efflux RND transporter permease subunit [Gammaproteobacteria bacterium]
MAKKSNSTSLTKGHFNLSFSAVKNRKLAYLVIIACIIMGIVSYAHHPSLEDPYITLRYASINAKLPGLLPNEMQNLITTKIEKALKQIPDVREINARSSLGDTSILVKISEDAADPNTVWQKLRNKMQDLKRELPRGTIGPVVITDYLEVTTATLALTGNNNYHELEKTAEKIRRQLYQVKNIGRIDLLGIQQPYIYLEANRAQLSHYNLTPIDLIQALRNQNILGAGQVINSLNREIIALPSGTYRNIEELKNTLIQIPKSKKFVTLKDIIKITRGYNDPIREPAYFEGQQTIVIAIYRNKNANLTKLGETLKNVFKNIQNQLPVGEQIHLITFEPKQVKALFSDLNTSFYQALIIISIIVILFLGFRNGIMISALIPLIILLTLLIMNHLGIALHRVSIASLIIALGLFIDNGIVVVESTINKINAGEGKVSAITKTYRHLAKPLLISTLTTIFAFLPIMLAKGQIAEYTRSLAQVITISLLCSLFLSFYALPALGY